MDADLIGPDGQVIDANSIRARMSADNQRDIDAKMASWFGHTSELAAYDADAVAELYKHSR